MQQEATGKRARTQPDLDRKVQTESVLTSSQEEQQKTVPRVSRLDKKVTEYLALNGLDNNEIRGKNCIIGRIGDTEIYSVRFNIKSENEQQERVAMLELSPKYGRVTVYDKNNAVTETIVQYENTVTIARPKSAADLARDNLA